MYSDININENWIQTWQQLDQELYDGVFDIEEAGETSEMKSQDQVQQEGHGPLCRAVQFLGLYFFFLFCFCFLVYIQPLCFFT